MPWNVRISASWPTILPPSSILCWQILCGLLSVGFQHVCCQSIVRGQSSLLELKKSLQQSVLRFAKVFYSFLPECFQPDFLVPRVSGPQLRGFGIFVKPYVDYVKVDYIAGEIFLRKISEIISGPSEFLILG